MAGRLAVDFGTSNTMLAVWDPTARQGVPVALPEFTAPLAVTVGDANHSPPVAPSLIHFADDDVTWVGQQVRERGLDESPRTFRWMKRYIAQRSPIKRRVGAREIGYQEAGQRFLASILISAVAELGVDDEEIALTVPVEAFEHYEDWLAGVATAAGMPRFRFIDEPAAAALGHGAHVQPGQAMLVFDFGGGTLDAAVVLAESADETTTGRRCRVLGKAGAELGGAVIDQWLFQECLRRWGKRDGDDDIRAHGRALLRACERAKETLSRAEQAEIVVETASGSAWSTSITRGQFEALLDEHDAYRVIDQTVRRALLAARERGFDHDDVAHVLMVGGSSLIPSVQQTARRIFGRDRVHLEHPLDAVARGAAAFVAGVDFIDHIQHDYALRYHDPVANTHEYRVIVKHGTPYPTSAPLAKVTVKAALEGQTHLGLQIYELGEQRRPVAAPVELVFDPNGGARLVQPPADEWERRGRFWINEDQPTFLASDPPAAKGEPRFRVEFGIDGNKRLVISALDLRTQAWVHRNLPVVKLT